MLRVLPDDVRVHDFPDIHGVGIPVCHGIVSVHILRIHYGSRKNRFSPASPDQGRAGRQGGGTRIRVLPGLYSPE